MHRRLTFYVFSCQSGIVIETTVMVEVEKMCTATYLRNGNMTMGAVVWSNTTT